MIPGIELNTGPRSTPAGTNYHIVGLDMEADVPRREGLMGTAGAQWLVDAIREQGGVAIVAHPYWSGLTVADVEGLRDHLGLEVYNADTEVHIGRGNSQVLWDDLLTRGRMPLGWPWTTATARGRTACGPGPWCGPRIGRRRRSWGPAGGALLRLLRAGDPGRHPGAPGRRRPAGADEPAGGTVTVRCSPARSITLVANATKGGRLNAGPFGMALRARRLGHDEMAGERPRRHRPEGVIDGDLLTGESSPSPGRRPTPGCRWRTSGGAWPGPTPFVSSFRVTPPGPAGDLVSAGAIVSAHE